MIERSGAAKGRAGQRAWEPERGKAEPEMKTCWIGVLLLALLAWAGTAEAGSKIGVVDVARVMRAHPDTAAADALLEKQLREFELEQDELLRRGKALKDAYESAHDEATDPALSEKGRAEKENAAIETRRAFRLFEKEYVETVRERQKQLTDQEHRMRRRIIDKVEALVADVAREGGYELVLDAEGRAVNGNRFVLFHSAPLDITDAVIARIGQEPADGETAAGGGDGELPSDDGP
jgi:outer membrane protein